jgi:hypothetical protein
LGIGISRGGIELGLDLYGGFQKKERGKWIFVEEYGVNYYYLMSWLAPWDTRSIEPIAPCRGFPPDYPHDSHLDLDFPDTASWLTADEILDSLPVIRKSTVRLSYDEFMKQRKKEYWEEQFDFTYVYDPEGQFTCNDRFITAKWRPFEDGYTIDSWGVDLFFDVSEDRGIKKFTDKAQELKIKHGEVRYVFHFSP